jgi:hypothetical protein
MPLAEQTIRAYLTSNIHYILDGECLEAMKVFFRMAAQAGALPVFEMPSLALKLLV